MYTVVKRNKYKGSKYYGNWEFDYNRSNSKIMCYENIVDANRRKGELQRLNPQGEYEVVRNQETCPNCLKLIPLKYMDWIDLCHICMDVLHQQITIAYLFPEAEA